MLRKLLTFIRLPWVEKAAVFEALFLLGWARFSVLTVPFARLVKVLGEKDVVTPPGPLSPEQELIVGRVARSIKRIQPFTPWDSNCLAQALTARRMLHRRGLPTTTYFGAAFKGQEDMIAHAWLRCGKWIITGADGHRRFAVVATFGDRENITTNTE